jgi:ribosomal protein L7/L12
MLTADEANQLQQRVSHLERQVEFLLNHLNLTYTEMSDLITEEIRDLLRRGRKIQAIKLYRDTTGAGLKAAKQYVESLL